MFRESEMVRKAKMLAFSLHQGQVDKAGKPYIEHVHRVAQRMRTEQGKILAWLHDTVEDTDFILKSAAVFGDDIVEALDAITRRKDEPWKEYILRVKANPLAAEVKINDLLDNSNLGRLESITLEDVARQKKYNKALQILLQDKEAMDTSIQDESDPRVLTFQQAMQQERVNLQMEYWIPDAIANLPPFRADTRDMSETQLSEITHPAQIVGTSGDYIMFHLIDEGITIGLMSRYYGSCWQCVSEPISGEKESATYES